MQKFVIHSWLRRVLAVLAVALVCSACGRRVQVAAPQVVPEPVFYMQKEGTFTLPSAPKISVVGMGQNSGTMRVVMQMIRHAHLRPKLVPLQKDSDIELLIYDTVNPELGSEGYLLEVRSSGISLSANTEVGLLYGFQTLVQMLPTDVSSSNYRSITLPECTVLDYPRFPFRGLCVDLGWLRPTDKELRRWVDVLSTYKMNRLCMRMPRGEGDAEPTAGGVQEWSAGAELVAYAAARGVQLSLCGDTVGVDAALFDLVQLGEGRPAVVSHVLREGLALARAGERVVMNMDEYCCLDYYQADPRYQPVAAQGMLTLQDAYSFDPAPIGTNQHVAAGVLGGYATLTVPLFGSWREAEYMLLPRLLATAEALWTPQKGRDWMRFRRSVEEQKDRLEARGYQFCEGSFTPQFEARRVDAETMNISIATEVPNTYIFYTLDGSTPTRSSSIYLGPINLRRGTHIKIRPVYKNEPRDSVYEYVIR